MMKLALSSAATGLLRALLTRADIARDRIYLNDFRTTDWQSLTFIGERHEIELTVPGPGAEAIVAKIEVGLGEAEFDLGRHLVADIGLAAPPRPGNDGSIRLQIEALTVESDAA